MSAFEVEDSWKDFMKIILGRLNVSLRKLSKRCLNSTLCQVNAAILIVRRSMQHQQQHLMDV